MELVSYRIPRKVADHRPVVIAPLGDIQWSGKRGPTATDTLRRHIDHALARDAYFIGMGDYIDFSSPSNRQRLQAAALYDTAQDVIDDKAMELTQEVFDIFLRPTKGRWLGLLEGHHFTQLKSGETTDQRLCQMLDAQFLGTSAYVRLQFEVRGTRGNVILWCHHGVGNGQTEGAPLNKLAGFATGFEGADVFLMGHTCKGVSAPINRVYPRWHGQGAPALEDREIRLVNTGGFSKTYIVGSKQGQTPRGGYGEKAGYKPVVLGAPFITIEPAFTYTKRRSVSRKAWKPRIRVEL